MRIPIKKSGAVITISALPHCGPHHLHKNPILSTTLELLKMQGYSCFYRHPFFPLLPLLFWLISSKYKLKHVLSKRYNHHKPWFLHFLPWFLQVYETHTLPVQQWLLSAWWLHEIIGIYTTHLMTLLWSKSETRFGDSASINFPILKTQIDER